MIWKICPSLSVSVFLPCMSEQQSPLSKKQQNILILILGFIAALGPFSIDMYLPGFPTIAEDLGTGISQVSLTLTSYFIGISVGQLIYGPLLDRFGRKKPLMIGLGIYVIASLGCALVPDVQSLIGLRLLQALGGCVGMVASRAIVRDRFPVNEVARVFSALILVMGAAPIIAPTVGGYLTDHFGWRFIFVLLSLISVIMLLLVSFVLSESKSPDKSVSLRLGQVSRGYWRVLTNRNFLMYGLAGSLAMAGLFTYIAGSPFVLMELYGFSEKTFGWVFGINAFGFIAGSQINGILLKKWDSVKITRITAVLILLVALLLGLSFIFGVLAKAVLLPLLFSFLFLSGFINPNTTALALEPFEKNAGVASALIGSFRMFAGAISSALIGILHNDTAGPMVWIMMISGVFMFVLIQFHARSEEARAISQPA